MYLWSELYCPVWRPSAISGVRGERRSSSRRWRRGAGVPCCPRPQHHRSQVEPANYHNFNCYLYQLWKMETQSVHGDDITYNTYFSILTVQVVSAGVVWSASLKAGEWWLGILSTLIGVHLDFGLRELSSGHHNPVLKFNTTRSAGNEDVININQLSLL